MNKGMNTKEDIDIHTQFITLIGTPLSQSFAAGMQNAAFEAGNINMRYFYTEAGTGHLKEIMEAIRFMPSFAGCAVTKPNKVKVLKFLDELDPLCKTAGACNTVVKQTDGKLKGYNTDGSGFLRSLKEDAGIDPRGRTFFCFGAGGAGRAICTSLAYSNAEKVYITDILENSSRKLCDDINKNFRPVAGYVEAGDYSRIPGCDVIINASGTGMGTTIGQSPVPAECICPENFCFDACYNPQKTRFLLDAEEKGCRVLNGLGMSLYQGVIQYELWTGKKAPEASMRQELLRILKDRSDMRISSGMSGKAENGAKT